VTGEKADDAVLTGTYVRFRVTCCLRVQSLRKDIKLHNSFIRLLVSMLASRVQTRLKPSDFSSEKILSMPSFGWEVKPSVPCRRFAACKRSLHLPWKSNSVGKIGSAISRPYFLPSLTEVSHIAGRGAPLEMTEETKNGAQRARSYGLGASGCRAPDPPPTLLYSIKLL
jgi:hypothetical protein